MTLYINVTSCIIRYEIRLYCIVKIIENNPPAKCYIIEFLFPHNDIAIRI